MWAEADDKTQTHFRTNLKHSFYWAKTEIRSDNHLSHCSMETALRCLDHQIFNLTSRTLMVVSLASNLPSVLKRSTSSSGTSQLSQQSSAGFLFSAYFSSKNQESYVDAQLAEKTQILTTSLYSNETFSCRWCGFSCTQFSYRLLWFEVSLRKSFNRLLVMQETTAAISVPQPCFRAVAKQPKTTASYF